MPNGAVYIITQDPRYVGLLLTSAASLKRAMPELPITVFSEFPLESPLFEKVHRVEPTRDGFYDKARLVRSSPYDRTLLIDADTYVLSSLRELFLLLDHFDCAATHEEYASTDWHRRYLRPDIPSSFPEFNTGVLMLKLSDGVRRMLEHWGTLYRQFLEDKPGQAINDQPFFREAAFCSEVRIATLTREYNCKFRGQGYLNGPVKILHGHVDLKIDPEFVEQAGRALNASTRPRVYIAGKVYEQELVGKLVDRRKGRLIATFPLREESELWTEAKRMKEILRERGLRKVVRRVLERTHVLHPKTQP